MIANLIQAQFGRADNWPLGATLAITTIAAVSIVSALAAAGARRAASRIL
jgi:spermidine/putrescine transport system permease protein